ncbi:MAG: deoxynucleoside kinase [Promethearchaeota archaeon]
MTAKLKLTRDKTYLAQNKKSTSKRQKKTSRDGVLIALAGVHGVGKTTIYELLKSKFAEHPTIRLFPERLRANPPVPFGSKDKQIAFRAELHYQQQMLERNRRIKQFITNRGQNVAITDRSPLSTLIYGRSLGLPKIDYELILDTYNSVTWHKEYIIYLNADPRTIMDRIYRRGSLDADREKWNEDDFQYLIRVMNMYSEVFNEFQMKENRNLFKINTDKLTPHQVVDQIVELIQDITGIQLINRFKGPTNQSKISDWAKKRVKKVKKIKENIRKENKDTLDGVQ